VQRFVGVMLEAVGLRKIYGELVALKGLDLRVEPGEIFCLLGANGAGKTTTIQLFLGFVAPSAGKVLIDNKDVSVHGLETKRALAYIPENVMLYPNLSGIENLRFFATLAGRGDLSEEELRETLKGAGLANEAVDRRVGTYSKGMRQKVGIALAVAKRARALLLDEPTSGLDPKASNEFSALLEQVREDGVAVLMATHDIFRSKEVGDRVGIMKHGELVAIHSTSDLSHADLERVYLEHMHD
jgi:ABC-2 type transport system ATP-binding protein